MTRSLSRATALAAAFVLSLVLAGCNLTTLDAKIAADASASLPAICALGASADAAFSAIAATGKLSATAIGDEAAAYAGLKSLCANPPQNLAGAIVEAGSIYAVVANSLNAAEGAVAARGR